MNALNIMHLLNEVDQKCKDISINYVKSKSTDWIDIETSDFVFYVDEYGTCVLIYSGQPKSVEKDVKFWNMVKVWVKKYFQENF